MIQSEAVSLQNLFDQLARNATVVTGNTRLAGALRHAYERDRLEAGESVWQTPDVLPWQAWIQRSWQAAILSGELPVPKLVLSGVQEQQVWEGVIRESTRDALQQLSATARSASAAWQLVHDWDLPASDSEYRYNDNSVAFRQWATGFEQRCRQQDWLPEFRLPERLTRHVTAWRPERPLVFTGFEELTPRRHALLLALQESGCQVHWVHLDGAPADAVRFACEDARHEADTAARWARHCLEENPTARIGIVVPDLGTRRQSLVHALDRILVPVAAHPDHRDTPRPYNLSLGVPLANYPIIRAALNLLELTAPSVEMERIGALLRSPFLPGWQSEAAPRALLDKRLREFGELQVSPGTLRRFAGKTDKAFACPELLNGLGAWQRKLDKQSGTVSTARWSARYAELLQAIGWGQGRALSSEEHQAVEAWRDLLGSFAALESVTKPVANGTALRLLQRMAGERIFQPRTPVAPIQVLGVLEAIGQRFDSLWVMGLHDGAWPVPPRPNPFVPLPLQRKHGLPRASEERELQVARQTIARLCASAAEVVFSYPCREGEEVLRPSPLIATFPVADPGALPVWHGDTWRDRMHGAGGLMTVDHDPAPPVQGDSVRGGSRVFENQAACPFRAFAESRLGASPLGEAEIGLDAMARGSLVHEALAAVWEKLRDHETLIHTGEQELADIVESIVTGLVEKWSREFPQTFTPRFRQVERARLQRQLLEWLELEKPRAPFKVIEREQRHEKKIAGLDIRLQVDRVDELEDGARIVIDYKTGEVKPGEWFGDRPEKPQLPLYSMVVDGEISGLAFAQVRAGAMEFNGIAARDGIAPGVKPYEKIKHIGDASTWEGVLENWRFTMEQLGTDFKNGRAEVDPKKFPDTCTYCDLKPLCRIHELREARSESES